MPGARSSLQAQPAVKSILVYRNGEPGRGPRRVVVHEKRVSDLEALLRELSGGARRLHTPMGHRVGELQDIQHRGTYVAAGLESFRKINYLQIGSRNKQSLQSNGPVKPVLQNRVVVAARFLKPIKEPCIIFVVANGDVLNPAVRFVIQHRVLDQFERILEMITEKMGLRILGGVRSLYTFDGIPITDGNELENGQFYVAVGRDKFKRLPYTDLLFTKPMGVRRVVRSKAASLPPIYGFRRQNGDLGTRLSKSMAGCSDSGDAKTSAQPRRIQQPVASLVREISQARLVTLRKKRSGLTMSLCAQEDDDGEQKTEEESEERESEEPSAAEPEQVEDGDVHEDEGPESEETTQTTEEAPTVEAENEAEEEGQNGEEEAGQTGEEEEGQNGEGEEGQTGEEEEGQNGEEEEGQTGEEEEGQTGEGEEGQTGEEEEGQTGEEEEGQTGEEEEGQANEGAANEEGGAGD